MLTHNLQDEYRSVCPNILKSSFFPVSQTLPWAPPPCRPPAVQPAVWRKATPTLRLLSASSACRSSFGSTWPPPTTWCTIRPLTLARRPLCPTWAWTSTCRPRWARCPASPTTRPCHRPSRYGTARYCRQRQAASLEASTVRPPALRTFVWGPSSMQHRWDWTRSPTEAWAAQRMHSPSSQGRTYKLLALSKGGDSGTPFTFLLTSHLDHPRKLITNIPDLKVSFFGCDPIGCHKNNFKSPLFKMCPNCSLCLFHII